MRDRNIEICLMDLRDSESNWKTCYFYYCKVSSNVPKSLTLDFHGIDGMEWISTSYGWYGMDGMEWI